MKSLSKKKTNKTEWRDKLISLFIGMKLSVKDKLMIDQLFSDHLSSERQEILDQIEKEVIGEDEFEMSQTNGTGTYPDTKEHYANQLRAELRQKLSALRKEEK